MGSTPLGLTDGVDLVNLKDSSRVLADHHHPKKATHPRSHAPRGNAVFDARRRDLRPRPGTRSVPDGIPTRSVGTRGKPPPDPCCGKADVKRAVVLSEDSRSKQRLAGRLALPDSGNRIRHNSA